MKYEWDLDGDGTFELNTGTTPTATKTYAAPGTVNIRLRVTDDGGNVGDRVACPRHRRLGRELAFGHACSTRRGS